MTPKGRITQFPELAAILDEVLGVSEYLWQRGWAERNAGNLSVDVTEYVSSWKLRSGSKSRRKFDYTYPVLAGRSFLVTGSGRRFRDVPKSPEQNVCILRISQDGNSYSMLWGGEAVPDFRPTSEFPTHLRLHESLRKEEAVESVILHTHPTELIALTHLPEYHDEAVLNRSLWCLHPEVKYNLPKGIGFVPYALPGSEALAQATADCFQRGYPVVLWEMHGCVAKARTAGEAFDLIDIATKAAKVLLLCRSAGHIPTGLTKQQLDELVRTFKLKE